MAGENFPVGARPCCLVMAHDTDDLDWVDTLPTNFYKTAQQFTADDVKIAYGEQERYTGYERGNSIDGPYVAHGLDKGGDWEVSGLFMPSGTAGTAPRIGPFFKAAMGAEAVVPATSVTYSWDATLAEYLRGLALYLATDDGKKADLNLGAIVKSFGLSWKANDYVRYKFAGHAIRHQHFLYSLLNASINDAVTSMVLKTGYGDVWGPMIATAGKCNIVVEIGTEDILISAYVASTRAATITRGYNATTPASHDGDAAITGLYIAQAVVGAPITSSDVTVSLDNGGTTIAAIDGALNVETGQDVVDAASLGDATLRHAKWAGPAKVSGEFSVLINNTLTIDALVRASRKTSTDMVIVLGATLTAGKKATLNLNQVYLRCTEFPKPAAGAPENEMVAKFAFDAHASTATAADSLTILLN